MASHCLTSDVSRLRCAVVGRETYTRVDPCMRDAVLATVGPGTHVPSLLAGAPSSGSSIRGRWTASYAHTRARWYARLAAAGVSVTRRQEGRRVVLCLGPAYAPCAPWTPSLRVSRPVVGLLGTVGPQVWGLGTICQGPWEHVVCDGLPAARLSCEHETLHRATDPTDPALYRRECSGAPRPWPVVRLLRFA